MSVERGTVGIVRPTQRTGGFDDLLRILPQGIRLVPLALDVQRGYVSRQAAEADYGVVIGENDPGPRKGEVIRHVLQSYVVRSKAVPNKEDDFPCSRVLLWCRQTTS